MKSQLATLARLELREVLRSRWLFFCVAIYAALAGLFLLVGLRESAVVGFTGMERLLLSLSHALVVLLPLMALTGTGLVVNRARQDGTMEVLFSHPAERGAYLGAVTWVRYGTLLVPLLVLMPGLALAGRIAFGEAVPWVFLARALPVSAALLWSFVGIGLAISVHVGEPAKAMVYVLVAWLLGVALLDFALVGAMLQWRLPAAVVFTLASLNPVEAARVALLAGADPSLETLGPVGFFLADRLGGGPLYAAGVLWPFAVGTAAWTLAGRKLRNADLI